MGQGLGTRIYASASEARDPRWKDEEVLGKEKGLRFWGVVGAIYCWMRWMGLAGWMGYGFRSENPHCRAGIVSCSIEGCCRCRGFGSVSVDPGRC